MVVNAPETLTGVQKTLDISLNKVDRNLRTNDLRMGMSGCANLYRRKLLKILAGKPQ